MRHVSIDGQGRGPRAGRIARSRTARSRGRTPRIVANKQEHARQWQRTPARYGKYFWRRYGTSYRRSFGRCEALRPPGRRDRRIRPLGCGHRSSTARRTCGVRRRPRCAPALRTLQIPPGPDSRAGYACNTATCSACNTATCCHERRRRLRYARRARCRIKFVFFCF